MTFIVGDLDRMENLLTTVQCAAHKVCAQAGLEPNDARWQLLDSRSSARRLVFLRRTIFRPASNPTMWKTSLPMSMPVDENAGAGCSRCFPKWLDPISRSL